uniref:uncharacterized protein LOC120339928 n=1 Tax=Styela clava TaxID=7725 RepID=UPI00193A4498|nr:uncharacterized protein LOC120339928 [Styela clava]
METQPKDGEVENEKAQSKFAKNRRSTCSECEDVIRMGVLQSSLQSSKDTDKEECDLEVSAKLNRGQSVYEDYRKNRNDDRSEVKNVNDKMRTKDIGNDIKHDPYEDFRHQMTDTANILGADQGLKKIAHEEEGSKELSLNNIRSHLELIEISLNEESETDANEYIEQLNEIITSPNSPKLDDIIKMVDNFILDSFYASTLFLLARISELYKDDSNSDSAARSIGDCSYQCTYIINSNVTRDGKFLDFVKSKGIGIIQQIVEDLRGIEGDTPVKTLQEARCLNNIGVVFGDIGEYEKEFKFYWKGKTILEDKFNSNAPNYVFYGDLLNNLGTSQYKYDKFGNAIRYYLAAYQAFTKRTNDWDDEIQKSKFIEIVTKNLQTALNKYKEMKKKVEMENEK